MDIQAIATQVAEAVRSNPGTAQELISDPRGAVERITGQTGFDVTEVLQAALGKLADMGVDLSSVDLSQLNLSEIDLTKLDIAQLQDTVGRLGIDFSKLDVGKLLGSLGGGLGGLLGGLGGGIGGLFGRK